jgi:NlpC/P60 family protein/sporulation related protein
MSLLKMLSLTLLVLFCACGCSGPQRAVTDWTPHLPAPEPAVATSTLKNIGYSIQVGAFANPGNAARLAALLENRGIDAYSFLHDSGLYKVRFGDHTSYSAARSEAENLQNLGMIDVFFIVLPKENAAEKIRRSGQGDLRQELVSTAHRFIGIPYNWGGTTTDRGFDCSGLTMVTYRLNGLNLPRVSRDQYVAGRSVDKDNLRKGDLVFFATGRGRRVTHVGIYIGNGRFIHAPRPGKSVRVTSLNNSYFKKTFVGARSYL